MTTRRRRRTSRKATTEGILYVLLITLGDKEVVKIGFSQRRRIQDRVVEILSSVFIKYRYFPLCTPCRFSWVADVKDKEKELHKVFKEYSYKPEHKFGGSTELFDVDVQVVIDAYDKLVKTKKRKKTKTSFFTVDKNL